MIGIINALLSIKIIKNILDFLIKYSIYFVTLSLIIYRNRKIIVGNLRKVPTQLKKIIDMLMKNRLINKVLYLLVLLVIYYFLFMRNKEDFVFKYPDLELELTSKDYCYMCCYSSEKKQPILVKKCYGGDKDGKMIYYKFEKKIEEEEEDKVITSGMFNNYIYHSMGSLIKFNDGNIYKIISFDLEKQPKDCSIVEVNKNNEKQEYDYPEKY